MRNVGPSQLLGPFGSVFSEILEDLYIVWAVLHNSIFSWSPTLRAEDMAKLCFQRIVEGSPSYFNVISIFLGFKRFADAGVT